jgi:hypothetical protein
VVRLQTLADGSAGDACNHHGGEHANGYKRRIHSAALSVDRNGISLVSDDRDEAPHPSGRSQNVNTGWERKD